jgi:alginate lyase
MSRRLATLVLCGLGLQFSGAAGQSPIEASPAAARPRVYSVRADALERAKQRLAAGDSGVRPAYDRLVTEANAALTAGPFSVMEKKRVPPSGDKHDYVSMGPYWWPDSTKPNGLPYIRRDGERNPEIRSDYDAPRLGALTSAVATLGLAYYFTGDERYADRAALLVRVWFLDPVTRMNPHLKYGQRVPGITEGRAAGIIETRSLVGLIDAIGMLERSPSWKDANAQAMRAWMSAYLQWLRTSEIGRAEQSARNNHGTWYDAQVAALALFTGDSALARATLEASKARRIGAQVTADGRQPNELTRTRSLSYSAMNLEGLCRLAELGRQVGLDLWSYEAPGGGGSIRKALDYLAPYVDAARTWPGQQITPTEPDWAVLLLERARVAYADGDGRYGELLRKVPADVVLSHRARLLYPPPPPLR